MKDAGEPLLGQGAAKKGARYDVFQLVEGQSTAGKLFLTLSFSITFVSFLIFAASTEPEDSTWHVSSEWKATFIFVERFTILFFTGEFIMRCWTAVELQDDVENMPAGAQAATRMCWAFTNVFAVVDLVCILPWYLHMVFGMAYTNTQWLRVIRILRALPDLPWGQIFSKAAPLLFAGGFAGVTVWIICASLYYMFERHNPQMIYSPEDGVEWNNFHSIPAAMYFTLVNFFGEFPLIDQHSTGGRFVGMFIQVAGASVMAIPAGALGNAFSDLIDDAGDDDDDDDDKDGGDGDGDAAADDKTKAKEPEAVTAPEPTQWLRALDGETGVMLMPYSEAIGGVDAGTFMSNTTIMLAFCSVAHFVLSSLTRYPGNLETTVGYLYVTNDLASIWLLAEYIYRLKCAAGGSGVYGYVCSTLGGIDFLACLPWLLWVFPTSSWVRASPALRILKKERFIGAFSLFWKIMCKQADAFLATGTMALVCWLLFSTLMYFSERKNVDPDMSKYYNSVFTSMWMTLLNLTGEVPVCQYTPWGKVLSGFMGLFGVGFVSIPMGLLGGGFEEKVEDMPDKDGDGLDDEEEDAAPAVPEAAGDGKKTIMADSEELTPRQKVFKFLAGSGENQLEDLNKWEGRAVRFEQFIILMIFASAVVATLEANGPDDNGEADTWEQSCFEAFVVILFTIEYSLRYYCCPDNPYWAEVGYVTESAARFAHVTSWSSILDVLAIAPYYMSLMGSDLADKYDGQLRMLRVFRLLTLDKYIPSVSLIARVVKNKAAQFRMAGYAMMALWVIFGALLWLTERHDPTQVDDLRMDQRYGSVISALPYTLVHLTGDYPLVDYTLGAKICLFFALIFAVGVVAVPAGLLANGFQSELAAFREEERVKQQSALSKVEKYIKAWILRRRFLKAIDAAKHLEETQAAELKKNEKANGPQWKMHLFLDGLTPAGKAWSRFMMLLILLNVAAVILESVEPVLNFTGQTFWDVFEFVSVLIFTVMYMAHIWVSPVDGQFNQDKYKFKDDEAAANRNARWNYCMSFWGIVDFITVAPFWSQQIMVLTNVAPQFAQHAFIFRVFRVLRILQAEDYIESFTLLDDAWFQCRDSMIACGFMAMMVWICGSVLFYNFEQGNPRMDGAFDTLPSSMYYSMIFLGGEWGLIDFTPLGQVVCVFYCVIGIALYGIPVGCIFEAFGSVLEERDAQAARKEDAAEPEADAQDKTATRFPNVD